MENLLLSIVPTVGTIIVVLINNHYKKSKRQEMLSEEIQEITKPDGSKLKKHKRKFK